MRRCLRIGSRAYLSSVRTHNHRLSRAVTVSRYVANCKLQQKQGIRTCAVAAEAAKAKQPEGESAVTVESKSTSSDSSGSGSGTEGGEKRQSADDGKSDYYYAGLLMLGTLFVGIPSAIVYELRFDIESREWADENAPAVVDFVGRYIDISGSEVEPEYYKVQRPADNPMDIDVRFANGTVVRVKAGPRESVYSVVHRAAQQEGSVSFRDVVDVKAAGDAEDLAATGLGGISSPLEVMQPSRRAAEELRAVLAELKGTAGELRARLQAAGGSEGAGGSLCGSEKLMGWDKLRKLEMTISSGEKQLQELEAQLPVVESTRQQARERAGAIARAQFEQAWAQGRPVEPWVGIAQAQGRS